MYQKSVLSVPAATLSLPLLVKLKRETIQNKTENATNLFVLKIGFMTCPLKKKHSRQFIKKKTEITKLIQLKLKPQTKSAAKVTNSRGL